MIKMLRMPPKYSVFTVLVWLCFLAIGTAQTQKNCEETLNEAQFEFTEGRFFNLPEILKNCLREGFSKEQKFRAYYLLTQAYLVLDKHTEAENSYIMLLKMNPEFVASLSRDPVELYYLSKKFTSQPKFNWHVGVGINTSFTNTLANVSTFSNPDNVTTTSSLQIGIPVAVAGMDINITKKWALGTEINFAQKLYAAQDKGIFANDEINREERSWWIDLPVYLKYQTDSGRLRPFFYAGYALNGLLSATANISVSDVVEATNSLRTVQATDVDFTHSRKALTHSLVFGSGIKFKLSKSFCYVDIRYLVGFNNLVKTENNFYSKDSKDGSLSTAITTYGYVNQLFRLDNLSVRFGYYFPHYNQRKIKTTRAKSFIEKVQWWKKKTPGK
ncbi:MAG: porin family protein [Cytophagales bacterium]